MTMFRVPGTTTTRGRRSEDQDEDDDSEKREHFYTVGPINNHQRYKKFFGIQVIFLNVIFNKKYDTYSYTTLILI